MKQKLFSFALIGILCAGLFAFSSCNSKNENNDPDDPTPAVTQGKGDYIDLALPSKTKWRDMNETGYYAYNDAVSTFGNKLPTRGQFNELINKCTWTWTGSGYTVVGPNGNSIYLPAEGQLSPSGNNSDYGKSGQYWSSTKNDNSDLADYPYYLTFNQWGKNIGAAEKVMRKSVRLVTK